MQTLYTRSVETLGSTMYFKLHQGTFWSNFTYLKKILKKLTIVLRLQVARFVLTIGKPHSNLGQFTWSIMHNKNYLAFGI